MPNKYGIHNIKTLEGIEAIRTRPGMYCGSVGPDGVYQISLEIISNSIDEYLSGECNKIDIILYEDNSISVKDNGRGVPFGEAKDGSETLENLFTKLHTGAKFNSDGSQGYDSSGGLNGVGSKATNALSDFFIVESTREGKIGRMEFERGVRKKFDVFKDTSNKSSGTFIHFKPDKTIFKESVLINTKKLLNQLEEFSYLCPNLIINFENKKTKEKISYRSKNGILDYLNKMTLNKKNISNPILVDFSADAVVAKIEAAISYTVDYSENIKLFTNNIPNTSGTHLTGFRAAMTRTINSKAREYKILKDKDENLTGEDLREGLNLVLSIKMRDPVFNGQVKDVLTSSEGRTAVEKVLNREFEFYFDNNLEDLKNIVKKALLSKKARLAAKKAREVTRGKTIGNTTTVLPGKLADCLDKTSSGTEIFLVEGSSAGGSAKQARDRKTQAILPLKGKILNVEKNELTKALENKEIKDMITAFGCGIGKEFDINKLRYEKIIIMTDSDVDGEHIKILLLTFFFNFMEELIKNGNIYVAMAPLYKVTKGKNSFYLLDDSELKKYKKENEDHNLIVQRFKGLGELSPEQLSETTMDKSKRKLKQIDYEDKKEVTLMFNRLMGNSVAGRKRFIEENAYKAEIVV